MKREDLKRGGWSGRVEREAWRVESGERVVRGVGEGGRVGAGEGGRVEGVKITHHAIRHPPSAIRYPPSAIRHSLLVTFFLNIFGQRTYRL
ncbi:MAG: hypothetical protein KKD28_07720 [Chloroflexi bacterium]|nr:hypothetical protein [Chloroflexota bacterium]